MFNLSLNSSVRHESDGVLLNSDTRVLPLIRRLAAGLLMAGLLAGCNSAPPKGAFTLGTVRQNLTYCNSQRMDLYIPRVAVTRLLPFVIYVHGGGMTGGDKSNLNSIFRDALASAGYAVASVNYRLAPKFHFPAQIEDVKCAVRYLRDKARKYGLNGRRAYAFGTSVGGQLTALAALTGPHSAFDVGPYLAEPSDLLAAVDMFGPANLTEKSSGFSSFDIEQVFGKNHHDLVLGSPTSSVAPNAPPILLVQGVDDKLVLKSQSIELYLDLKAAGDQTQLVLVRNMGHMFAQAGPMPINPGISQIANDMVRFFNNARTG